MHPWLIGLFAVAALAGLTIYSNEIRTATYTGAAVQSRQLAFSFLVRCLVTVGVLVASLYLILHRNSDAEYQKWAYGALGTVVGYWLRG